MEKFKQYYCDHKNKGKFASNNSEHENISGKRYDKSNACNSKVNQIIDSDPSVIDLLFYAFYLPTVLDGPIFIYKDFHNQVKNSFSSSYFYPDIYDIAKKLIRLSFWALFTEFQFHFLYYSALSLHPRIISALSPWTLAGIAYCQGQFFMIKYLVMYGTSIQLSRFDGIIPIAAPRCIGWVFLFKDLWKYFDVGLYNFLKTYIYIPLGGSEERFLQQVYSLCLSSTGMVLVRRNYYGVLATT
jgi:D-alanyl-lipoteichoic acid acyltransferase DltB (MBOAT superfamily)